MEYLIAEDIYEINRLSIERHGGNYNPPKNLLNEGSVEYVVEAVQSVIFGQEAYPTVSDKAGLYMFSIINNHAFSDGNKRTGLEAALLFLRMNNLQLAKELSGNELPIGQERKFINYPTISTLNQRIADFYNASTDLWLDAWGDHMHHGYYGPDGSKKVNHQEAQVDMIEALIEWGNLPDQVERIFDAGCGVGASSRYLAQRFPGASALGLTLSPVQAARGKAFNERAGLANRCEITAGDVYQTDAEPGTYDLIWSMESAEHMGDKKALFDLFYRLLRPGGTVLMATWCHRDEPPRLTSAEQANLDKLCKLYHLPPWVSIPTLAKAATAAGFAELRTDDWSEGIAPFWGAVIKESLKPKNWPGLLRSGPGTLKGAWAMRYMQKGFREGSIRYGMLTATKK